MQPTKDPERAVQPRDTYRHGDLRRALIEAGIELARHGGPEAVVLREATRRAGVVPNAAYRHFADRDDLLAAVRMAALAAIGRAIHVVFAQVPEELSPSERASARFRAVGLGYIGFAVDEPGLFRTALSGRRMLRDGPTTTSDGPAQTPFDLLGAALDEMVAQGLLPPERRPGAEFLAWSAVHGFANLVVDGPLAGMGDAQREAFAERLVAMVERGV